MHHFTIGWKIKEIGAKNRSIFCTPFIMIIWLKNFDFFPKHKNLRQFSGNVWKIDFQIFKINCKVLKTIFQTWKSCHSKLLFFPKSELSYFKHCLFQEKNQNFPKIFFLSIRNYFLTLFDPKYVQNYSGFLLAKILKDNLTHLEEMK